MTRVASVAILRKGALKVDPAFLGNNFSNDPPLFSRTNYGKVVPGVMSRIIPANLGVTAVSNLLPRKKKTLLSYEYIT